jgi:endonuclease YncB( thermonuclease family)
MNILNWVYLTIIILGLSCTNKHEKKVVHFDENRVYKVIKIIDGDTYDVLIDNKPQRVRVDAIDAPEKGMPFYKVSKNYLGSLCFKKEIRLKKVDEDSHGRWVCRGYTEEGLDLSVEMVKAGLAWHYKKYSKDKELAMLEEYAKSNKLGLWSDALSLPPWEVRAMHRKGISTKDRFEFSVK